MTWHMAATICEEIYGSEVNTAEGFFICPECDEPLYESDGRQFDWDDCPVCGFMFFEEE